MTSEHENDEVLEEIGVLQKFHKVIKLIAHDSGIHIRNVVAAFRGLGAAIFEVKFGEHFMEEHSSLHDLFGLEDNRIDMPFYFDTASAVYIPKRTKKKIKAKHI